MEYLHLVGFETRIGDFRLGPVDLAFEKGGTTAILGPSGCGKSTLLRAMCGLLPTKGKIFLEGKDISKNEPSSRRMALMFQDYALFPHMNAFKNISFPLAVKKIEKKRAEEMVRDRAKDVDGGLEEKLLAMPKTLPEGLKQATAFARETVREFDILMLDEPFSRLDAHQKEFVRADLKLHLKDLGKTYIVVVSDVIDALAMADRIAVLIDGRIVQHDLSMKVYANPATLEAARLTSPFGLNVVRCAYWEIPAGCVMAFRPDAVAESEDGQEFEVDSVEPLDSHKSLVHLKKNECEIVGLLKDDFERKKGDRVKISLIPDRYWLFKEEKI